MNINSLPIEIQTKIWNYYWSFKFNDVLKEIGSVIVKDKYIYDFLIRYALSCSGQHATSYKYHFSLINEEIEDICKNPGLKLIAKYNKLHIKNINVESANFFCASIKKRYRYSCYYILLVLRFDRRLIMEEFSKF